MSKELAQTVGTKKIAWLLAILAAFAVFATVGSEWRPAKANVTQASYTLAGPFVGSPDCTTPAAATVPVGTGVHYCLTAAADPTEINPVVVTVTIPNFSINDLRQLTIGGPQPVCTGGGTGTATCTFTGLTAGNSIFSLFVGGTFTGRQVLAAGAANTTCAGPVDATIDDPSNQPQVCATDNTAAITVTGSAVAIDKAHTPVGNPPTGTNVTYTLTVTNPLDAVVGANATNVTVTDTIPAGNFSSIQSVSPSQGTCSGTGPYPDASSPWAISCALGTVVQAASATVVIVATLDAIPQADPGDPAICETVDNTANVTADNDPGDSDLDSFQNCGAAGTAIVNDTVPALRHVDPRTGLLEPQRDVDNNVVGFVHTVCAVNVLADALWPTPLGGSSQNFQITTVSGTANINGAVVTPGVDCDDDGFSDDSTISWYSTQPGEQNVVIVDDGGTVVLDWGATGGATGGTAPFDNPLVKEWNTLLPTTITGSALTPAAANVALGVSPNLDGTTVTRSAIFDPVSGQLAGTTTLYENVLATHTNLTGTQVYFGIGANVTFTVTGCGTISLTDPTSFFDPVGSTSFTRLVTVVSNGKPIKFVVNTDGGSNPCTSFTNSSTVVKVQAAYPTNLGSNTPIIPAETVTVKFVAQAQVKQVLLAWAGQRVVLEHDWRIPPGDDFVDGEPLGDCPFTRVSAQVQGEAQSQGFDVRYVKSATSPGNFVDALDVTFIGPDQVEAFPSGDNSQIGQIGLFGDPQSACISRAMYESEDPGEVDVEAWIEGPEGASTKIAFVVYYMKFNSVTVSLVTQVSKPTHNSSALPDYSPGNPWDATKDDADNAADWNVSKDLLVRGRVTGWFTNANPSGRAQDATDPLNVLPANRWIMPQDWPLIAGGPADPTDGTDAIGTAESFRPTYDIMFAPNNTRGLTLSTPTGSTFVTLATVIAPTLGQAANSALAVHVSPTGDLALLAPCTPILVGTSAATVGSITASTSTLTLGTVAGCGAGTPVLAATPAVGTVVSVLTGVPFEGPFSLIDIIGLAAQGLGGAAESNILASTSPIRDTALDDGDVDMWDAPMPPADVSVAIRGTGFIKQVIKSDVYYLGTANSVAQTFPNPFYVSNIPDNPFISANAAGGGYIWDSWGNDGPQAAGGLFSSNPPGTNGDGPYQFWVPVIVGTNEVGIGDALTAANQTELQAIRNAYGDQTIARDLVVFSDNHGEFMVTANGDFKTDLTACATNVLASGKHCKPGDKVGTGSISATADYPDFRKHFPVKSNTATVTWLWGGYKDVTVEAGETDQFKYIVFHAMDRDGFCSNSANGAVLLHPVLSSLDALSTIGSVDPVENVDFLIDSGEGIIIAQSDLGTVNDGKQFVTGALTFSLQDSDPALGGPKEFPLSPLAAAGQTDECQTWIKVSNSLLGVVNVLVIAHDDEGNIGFDRVIDLTNTTSYTLNFRWSLITWAGADGIPVMDALKGTGTSGKNPGGNDISASVTAIYGWNQAAQQWLGFFPTGVNVPGANDLTSLSTGQAYWIAITGPSSVTWTIASNVS